jgi:hypothetical protein
MIKSLIINNLFSCECFLLFVSLPLFESYEELKVYLYHKIYVHYSFSAIRHDGFLIMSFLIEFHPTFLGFCLSKVLKSLQF